LAGMVHAFVLLLIMLFLGKWASLIPMATLAGILFVVAYNMSEWRLFVKLLRGPRSDVLVLMSTFVLTLAIDLATAIQVGVVLAALLFMRRMADVTQVGYVKRLLEEEEEGEDANRIAAKAIPEGVEVFEVNGPFFFGAADKFREAIGQVESRPRVLILRLRSVLSLDATGLLALEQVCERTNREGTRLLLSGVHAQPLTVMQRSGFLQRVGEENIFSNIDEALAYAGELAGSAVTTKD